MVSINKLTREELTTIIAQELHIDVAFPGFSVEEQTGATACCVVNKRKKCWILLYYLILIVITYCF